MPPKNINTLEEPVLSSFFSRFLTIFESIVKFVFRYIILPWLISELGIRWYYQILFSVIRGIFRIPGFLFNPSGLVGLFAGGDEDSGFDTGKTGDSIADSIFDTIRREDQDYEMEDMQDRTSILQIFNSAYYMIMDRLANQNLLRTLNETFEEVFFIFEKADYLFDRYIKHSPFCVLNKLNPNGKKSHYEFEGVALSKYEGFADYLKYNQQQQLSKTRKDTNLPKPSKPVEKKKDSKPIVLSKPHEKAAIPVVSKLTQTTNDSGKQFVTLASPTFNFDSTSFPAALSQGNRPFSPKRIKLDKSGVQPFKQSFQVPEKFTESTRLGNTRIVNIELPNKKNSNFKLLIKPKYDIPKTPKQGIEVLSSSTNKRIQKSIAIDNLEYIDNVKQAIRQLLPNPIYDDGSLGPIVLRLAWHCCATYNKFTGDGGSNGATMRFAPEITDDGNTGLDIARIALEPIKQKFPAMTYSDIWTLAGKVAIEAMGGPIIPWKCGRIDCIDDKFVPPNGRLPFAYKNANHIRETFSRMGFDDREAVLLLGAHGLGRCHRKFSGFDGKWTPNPISFTNDFYKVLINEDWVPGTVPETGKEQFYNEDRSLIMLNTDLELIRDHQFLQYVKLYSENQPLFFHEFADAFGKLLELGIERDVDGNVLPKKEFF